MTIQNHLLRSLPKPTLDALSRHLELERLDLRRTISDADRAIERICFPESGLISVRAVSRGGGRIEAAMIGAEGMTGSAVVLGDDRTPHEVVVQCPGEGYFLPAHELRRFIAGDPQLAQTLLRFVHAFMTQLAHTALADGRGRLDQRLARWLLMAQDRLGRPEVPVTHESLAALLGVRRAGVTVALNGMERAGAIGMSRGVVAVKDRDAVEALAGPWYGVPEGEYRRLLGEREIANAA
ncbi:MAG TPA: Crp/Fnr family transcriptional regulator [Caulobacteraceae bacterium]|jgi:CRP-like cAMP-binding protein|nr:Crp/Fnr family transcriptional regulator [Caulobacteraceae bacterium]